MIAAEDGLYGIFDGTHRLVTPPKIRMKFVDSFRNVQKRRQTGTIRNVLHPEKRNYYLLHETPHFESINYV